MTQPAGSHRDRRAIRKVFLDHTVGMHAGNTLDDLKDLLYEAGVTTSSAAPLDVVIVQDVEHYYELVAESGIPLARDEQPIARADDSVQAGEGI